MVKSLLAISCLLLATCSQSDDAVPATAIGTGYPTTAAAWAALHARKDVTFTTKPDHWTIANDTANNTVWSFPPQGHPAYPAAVKRQFVQENGKYLLKMTTNCEAPALACAQLVAGFTKTNDALVQQLNGAR